MNKKSNPKAKSLRAARDKTRSRKNVKTPTPLYQVANLSKWVTIPPSILIRLRYPVQVQINNVGGLVASNSYNINGIYDVDPLLASTNTPGFTEWSAFYRQNQVAKVKIHGSVTNLEAQPLGVYIQAQPTTIASNTLGRALIGNRFSQDLGILSPKGGQDRAYFRHNINLADLFGDPETYWGTLNNYKGTGASNPSTLFQWAIGVQSSTAVLTAGLGAYAAFWIDFDVYFSNPIYLSS